MKYLLHNLSELAERRAVNIREEAKLWDILSRDLKRAAKEIEQVKLNFPVRPKVESPEDIADYRARYYVGVKEARKLMGWDTLLFTKKSGRAAYQLSKPGVAH